MIRSLFAFSALALVCVTNARADFSYPNFASTAGLTINGNATTTVTGDGSVLRLTPAATGQLPILVSFGRMTTSVACSLPSTFLLFTITTSPVAMSAESLPVESTFVVPVTT